jgi:hypothetical protein
MLDVVSRTLSRKLQPIEIEKEKDGGSEAAWIVSCGVFVWGFAVRFV